MLDEIAIEAVRFYKSYGNSCNCSAPWSASKCDVLKCTSPFVRLLRSSAAR